MDELDQLAEQPPLETRRAVNTISFDFAVGTRSATEDLREGLVEALRDDAELQELHAAGHPKVMGVAVDPPRTAGGVVSYRVHIDFGPGEVDEEMVRAIIQSDVDAELLAAG